jgi:hypothetical protein
MGRTLSESEVIRSLAHHVCKRVTGRVVRNLQKITNGCLSGEDSGLKSAWDEICVQVQYEESLFWDVYEEMVRGLTRAEVEDLEAFEREALWLQTPAGSDWSIEDESDRESYPVVNDDLVEYLLNEGVYSLAANWGNDRIRAYLERSIMTD